MIILDPDGLPLRNFSCRKRFEDRGTSHRAQPLTELLIVLGGPRGIGDAETRHLKETVDFHIAHDKGELFAVLEDHRYLGDDHEAWQCELDKTIAMATEARISLPTKFALLKL